MTDIIFYEFVNSKLEKSLPKLVQLCIEKQLKVVIQCESEKTRDDLNSLLWIFEKESFLPHGTEADGYSDKQPVYLTCINENPNGAKAKIVFGMIDTGEIDSISDFDRYMIFIDNTNKDTLKAGSEFFQELIKSGFQPKYQQQNSNGGWSEKVIE